MFKTLGKNIWTHGKYKLLIKFEHAVLVRGKEGSAPYKKFNGFFNAEQFNNIGTYIIEDCDRKVFPNSYGGNKKNPWRSTS